MLWDATVHKLGSSDVGAAVTATNAPLISMIAVVARTRRIIGRFKRLAPVLVVATEGSAPLARPDVRDAPCSVAPTVRTR
jgi:hypothetical protein